MVYHIPQQVHLIPVQNLDSGLNLPHLTMVFSGAIILPLVPAGNIQKADTAGNYIFNAKIPYHDFYAAYRTNTVKGVIDDVDLTSGATYSSKLRTLEFHITFPVAGIIIFLLAIAGICIAVSFASFYAQWEHYLHCFQL